MDRSIAKILSKLRVHFAFDESELELSPDVEDNLRSIQLICNSDYYDQRFYGNAALNRKILLDARIAQLLTPETISAIFLIHAKTATLNFNSPIAIRRNSSGLSSLAAVLFYGFNEGLETIESMPNNESLYGKENYLQQKDNFLKNTEKIIENIKRVATQFNIEKEEDRTQETRTLTEMFESINNTISKIKEDKKEKSLLYVPGYSADEIRSQSLYGFSISCQLLGIKHKIGSNNTILLIENSSLDDFVNQFISSDEVLLHGKVIHLFYDRVHLEACIEQNIQINFQNKNYYLRDVLKEIVKKIDGSQTSNHVAREQFSTRLALCDVHLRENFSNYYLRETILVDQKLPLGYLDIKQAILSIEANIEKKLWDFSYLINLYSQRDFLKSIINFYDQAEGKLNLKQSTILAKWQEPKGYKLFTDKMGYYFFLTMLNEKLTQEPIQGPRQKNHASIELENLLHHLLNGYEQMKCSYNAFNELEISIDNNHFNLSQILLHKPDFEHLSFSEKQLAKYANFVNYVAPHKPFIKVDGYEVEPTVDNYKKMDPHGEFSHLQYGEKLAISTYLSGYFYPHIQHFLRSNGRLAQEHDSEGLNILVPEIILSAAIATHGLSKPMIDKTKNASSIPVRNYRKEHINPNVNFFKARLTSLQNKSPLVEKGFLSTSADNSFQTQFANINVFNVIHEESSKQTLGRRVSVLSSFRHENEFVYSPGTQFQYTDYHKVGSSHFFSAKPMRSIEGYEVNSYTVQAKTKHELQIVNKMFELYLINNKHSSLRRLFDTVSNDEKLSCVRNAKNSILTLIKNSKETNLSAGQLEEARMAILTAIEANKAIVSKATIASLGKTDKVLQEALIRVERVMSYPENKPQNFEQNSLQF
ncbi:MAG: hypothetical protein H0U70_03715 [Tatlockia sp.]|nr:hypothetical protein [Tatlockia sp.]